MTEETAMPASEPAAQPQQAPSRPDIFDEITDPFARELADHLRAVSPHATVTHVETLPARKAVFAPWPEWTLPDMRSYLEDFGVHELWRHQAAAADAIFAGRHTVIATGTSSGKSLGYQLPILTHLAQHPNATALYLTPTKALSHDQLAHAERLIANIPSIRGIMTGSYDGDTPMGPVRRALRDHARWIFSNVDMLHASIMSNHALWGRFLRNLAFIVIDESHAYRGVFGAHTSWVFRRLLRLAAMAGAQPVCVVVSATSAAPVNHAARLTGLPVGQFEAVTTDDAPSGTRTVLLWEPPDRDEYGRTSEPAHNRAHTSEPAKDRDGQTPLKVPATTEAARLMAALVAQGARTLTFVRSRRSAETVAEAARSHLSTMGRPQDATRVKSYRAGYLAEDRRQLERELDNGELLGVASTNALELGVDIGGLDAVICAGYPGSIASLWQQAGRAGRRGQSSLVVLVGRDDPMDTYLIHHPEALLRSPIERTVFDPLNPYIMAEHVYAAAVEKPLTSTDVERWEGQRCVDYLTRTGLLRERGSVNRNDDSPGESAGNLTVAGSVTPHREPASTVTPHRTAPSSVALHREPASIVTTHRTWYPVEIAAGSSLVRGQMSARGAMGVRYIPDGASPATIHQLIPLRGSEREQVTIVERETARVLGFIERTRAMTDTHAGAHYLHQGMSYVVDELSLRDGVAYVSAQTPPWTTRASEDTNIDVLGVRRSFALGPTAHVALLDVEVTRQVTHYTTYSLHGHEAMEVTPLDLPPVSLTTTAAAYTITPEQLTGWGIPEIDWPGALHAAEHAAIGILPLLATCDRADIGGVSTALHQHTGLPTVFVYDGYPGGAGFAQCGFENFQQWIAATAETVRSCRCATGCPACIQSPKCGNGNEPLFKAGALAVLDGLGQLLR